MSVWQTESNERKIEQKIRAFTFDVLESLIFVAFVAWGLSI